jgi:hypothetical protein
MQTKLTLLAFFILGCFVTVRCQQTRLDETDSLANHQKQFIVRFNVANGNVYVPVKKNISNRRKEQDYFKKLPFLFKNDSFVNTKKIVSINTKFDENNKPLKSDTIFEKQLVSDNGVQKFLSAGRFFRPKVGSFIRIIFENVPKGMDVNVTAEFLDKNLENASTFEGFLSRYQASTDSAVTKDAAGMIKDIEEKKEELTKAVDSTKKSNIEIVESSKKIIQGTIDSMLLQVNQLQKVANEQPNGKPVKIFLKNAIELLNTAKNNLKQINQDTVPKILEIIGNVRDALDYLDPASTKTDANDEKIEKTKDSINMVRKDLNSSLNKVESQIEDMANQRKNDISKYDSLSKVLAYVLDSVNNKRTIYIQPIQVANNDITLLKITYKKDDKQQNDIYREILFKNKFGFKLDFSTGFIGTGLKDDNYRIIPAPNTLRDTSTIIADPKGNFSIGFALLAHAYFRSGERVNFALNSGLMLNGSNQTINYLTGFSLPLGLEQRFILGGGIAFGKVKRLTTGYQTDIAYPAAILNLASGVPYTEKWQQSWYIGVSYNISSLTSSSHKVVIAK